MPNSSSRLNSGIHLRTYGFYLVMITVAIGVFMIIRHYGNRLVLVGANALAGQAVGAHAQINTLLHVLLALAVVIVTARAIGALFKLFHQPPVIGEVIGGILLGPSFLGRVAPDVYHFVLPESAAPFLGIIAQLGVILYMFLVGLELDLKVLKRSGHATLAISHASIIIPFLLGATLALHIFPTMADPGVTFTSFALFLGV